LTKLLKKSLMKKNQKALFLSVFCSFLLLSATGCVSQRVISVAMSQGTTYEKALNSYLQGDFQKAQEFVSKVKKGDKDYKSAQLLKKKATKLADKVVTKYLQIGDIYEKTGILLKAEDVYNVALKVNPDSQRVKNRLQRLSLRGKEKFLQIKEKTAPVKVVKVDIQKDYNEGMAFYKKEQYSLAIEKFHKVLKNNPSYKNTNEIVVSAKKKQKAFISTHMKKGTYAYQQENLEQAVKEWNLVLREDPENAAALNYKSKAVTIMKKLKELRK